MPKRSDVYGGMRPLFEASGRASLARRTPAQAEDFLTRIITTLLPTRALKGNEDPERVFLLAADNNSTKESYRVQLFLVEPGAFADVCGLSAPEVKDVFTPELDNDWSMFAIYRDLGDEEKELMAFAQVIEGRYERSGLVITRRERPHAH